MRREGVSVAVFDENKEKILLVKRCDVPIWVLPGGGIDENEPPEQAGIREVFEESGLKIAINRKIAEYSPINNLSKPTHFFEGIALSGELMTGPETRDLGFFSIRELPQPFFFIHEIWLKEALKNQKEIIRRPLTEVNYFSFFKYFLRHPIRVIRFLLSISGFPINTSL